jgi:transposase InsO family protein
MVICIGRPCRIPPIGSKPPPAPAMISRTSWLRGTGAAFVWSESLDLAALHDGSFLRLAASLRRFGRPLTLVLSPATFFTIDDPTYTIDDPTRLMAEFGDPLGMRCRENGIEHRLTKPNHPWTNGQVERMNRTLKEATVKRYHYESHDQLCEHLASFLAAYNFAKRLKTLRGLTPHEYICKIWNAEPDRFKKDPTQLTLGLYT